jgi:Mn-dependent DtxR family transcriptional regulator
MKNITLTLRVSPDRAVQILNRLYGCGEISRDKYLKRLSEIGIEKANQERDREMRLERLIADSGGFYKRKAPTRREKIGDDCVGECGNRW